MRNTLFTTLIFLAMTVQAATDPTKPPNWTSKADAAHAPKEIVLSGIFDRANEQTAIINEKSLRVGDFVKGYEVTKITSNTVYLKNNRGIFMVTLDSEVTTPVTDVKGRIKGSR